MVGRDRGTPEPKATVGVVERGVDGVTLRLSIAAVGVRRPEEEVEFRAVRVLPDRFPVEPAHATAFRLDYHDKETFNKLN